MMRYNSGHTTLFLHACAFYAASVTFISLPYSAAATASAITYTASDEGQSHVQTLRQTQEAAEMPPPPPPLSTPAADSVSTTTEASQEQSSWQHVEYSPIYNTRMKPCPGYSSEGLKGYTTLDDLRHDLQLYFYDTNGYSYHRTAADMITESPTDHPSLSPTLSEKPTVVKSDVPSVYPTQQPVSAAPTEYPTSSVRLPKEPTKSPSPTMLPKFAGAVVAPTNGSDGVADGGSGTSASSGGTIMVNIPEGALDGSDGTGGTGDGSGGMTSAIVLMGGDDDPMTTTNVTGPTASLAPIPIPSLRTGSPSKSPTLSPIVPDENQMLINNGGTRKRIRGSSTGGDDTRIRRRLQEEEEGLEDGEERRQLQMDGTTSTKATIAAQEYVEVMNVNGEGEVDEIITDSNGDETLIPVTTHLQQHQEQPSHDGIHFNICPDTTFRFNNLYVTQLNYPPLVIESPVRQHFTLACLKDNQCTFVDGDYHIVFNNNGLDQGSAINDDQHGMITVSGIKFQKAEESSIVMNDPRGMIVFSNCTWENNEGEAIVVDGKYSGKNLEVVYYGPDNYMLPDGKENPHVSTDPTTIPAETTAVNMDFLFGGTTEAAVMSTEFLLMETTVGSVQATEDTGMGRDLEGDEFDERSLQPRRPNSLIVIKDSTFTGNRGEATIAVDSSFGSPSGSFVPGSSFDSFAGICLQIEDSTFTDEKVQTSVIMTSGAKVHSTGNVFEKNTASSMFQTELGAISITDTQFADNVVTGGEGIVVIDSDSKVGDNNCAEGADSAQGTDKNATVLPLNSRQGGPCNGTYVMGGTCLPFGGVCDPEAVAAIKEHMGGSTGGSEAGGVGNETESGEVVDSNNASETNGSVETPAFVEGCHDDWASLKNAVENKIIDGVAVVSQVGSLHFKICPESTLYANSGPIVIDYDDVTVQCGGSGLKSDNCEVVGGFVQFHIIGSAKNVKLTGLRMTSSTGSSIVAAGAAVATLQISDCEWMTNKGASAVLIRHNATVDNSTGTLDIMSMLDSSGPAMTVGMSDVGFMQNVLTHGTVVNVGGSLMIDRGRFNGNEIKLGDVVVSNDGALSIANSCFDNSASMAPGTIFIDNTSLLKENGNNFGWDNTDGGFDGGVACTDIFVEAAGSDCSTGSNCNGTCTAFTSKTCPLDVTSVANNTSGGSDATKNVPAPYVRSPSGSDVTNLVPIVVAVLVVAFIVFGLAFIIFKRSRKAPASVKRFSAGDANYEDEEF